MFNVLDIFRNMRKTALIINLVYLFNLVTKIVSQSLNFKKCLSTLQNLKLLRKCSLI